MQSGHVSLERSQVLIVAIFRKGEQLLRYFRTSHVILIVGKLRLLILVVLRGFDDDEERLPGCVLIVNLNDNKTDLEKPLPACIVFNTFKMALKLLMLNCCLRQACPTSNSS